MLNQAIRKYAIESLDVASDASDDVIKAAVTKALQAYEKFAEKYAELLAVKDVEPKSVKDELVSAIGEKFDASIDKLAEILKPKAETPPDTKTPAPKPADTFDADKTAELLDGKIQEVVAKAMRDMDKAKGLTEWDVLGDAALAKNEEGEIRVKAAMERYDDTKYVAKRKSHSAAFDGQPIVHNDQELYKPTELDMVRIGSWVKFQLCPELMTEHEKEIVSYAIANDRFKWCDPGKTGSRRLRSDEQTWMKAFYGRGQKVPLLDDSTSGGEEAVPEWYDMHVAILPVLGGEVSPFVTMVDMPRGSEAESFLFGNPTFASGATEGTAVTLFDATSLMTDYSPAVFRAHGGIEIGKNLLQDSMVDLASLVVNRYLAKAAEWLDEQICNGDGTTEPQGLKTASGTTDITPATPTTGPLVIGDLLNLAFGVSKAFRQNYPRQKMAFIMTDETYKDLRSIATGVTGDTRLIFGQDELFDYTLFHLPVAIEENGMTNTDLIFGQLGGYRLYRRQGPRFVREDRGQELVTSNSMIVYCDMRYGGQIERGGYAAIIDAAPP